MTTSKVSTVMISFKKVHLAGNQNHNKQKLTDLVDGRKSSPVTVNGPRRNLPLRSFSLCSILSRSKTDRKSKTPKEKEGKKVMNAVIEIERFEKDFVLPLFKINESDERNSCDGISLRDI